MNAVKQTETPAGLVRQAQQGSREAMAALYEQTAAEVYRTIRALVRDPELARDVQQEVYLRAFTSIGQLSDPEKLLPWLRRIAQNQAKTALKRQRPLLFSELEDGSLPELADESADASPELALEADERSARISRVLSVLGDGQRMIVGMYYREQLSVREIAQALGLSVSTVKSQLSRGRKRIERELNEQRRHGEDAFGAALAPFVRLWRQQPQQTGDAEVLRRVLTQLGGTSLRAGRGAALARIAAAGVTVVLLGGAAFGIAALHRLRQSPGGDMRPPETTEALRTELPTEEPPTEAPTEAPTEPPTEPPTEQVTEPVTEPPTEAPAEPPTATAAQPLTEAPPATEAAPTDAPATLPTESPVGVTYHERTVSVGERYTERFAAAAELEVNVFVYTPGLAQTTNVWQCYYSNGEQTVVIDANEPGVYIYALRRADGTGDWIPWLHLTVLASESPASPGDLP